ncbi:MAG: xanthine dehydrogenase family protein subunit M [Gemmatimonadales bacterium]
MIPAGFDYVRAKSVREALSALAAGDSKLLAGGHSLIPLMRFRLAQPGKLVDIGGLDELRGISAKGKAVRIGAATTYRDILDDALIAERYPLMIEATLGIGDTQVRNRGTVGGGLAHADPASDMPAVMLALDATFNLRSKAGKRSVSAREFFQGPFETAMKEDELFYEIVLPAPPKKAGMSYVSFEQLASGYPIAAAAAVVTKSRKSIKTVTLALTGVGEKAYLANVPDAVGTHGDDAALDAALSAVADAVVVNSDVHASAEYRAHLARVAAKRAIQTALGRAG